MDIRELTTNERDGLLRLQERQEQAGSAELLANNARREYIDELEKKHFSALPPITQWEYRQITFDANRKYIISTVLSNY